MTILGNIEAAMDDVPSRSEAITLIIPPAEIRKVVEKTAAFVAKNGAMFEDKIRQKEIDNPKFKFLDPKSPFHAFYQTKIKQILEGNATSEAPSQPAAAPTAPIQKTAQEQFKVPEKIVLTDPPPEPVFIIDPPTISGHDLELVKMTAQFVARNGRQFLTNLMSRESRNSEFDFLRPQHTLFRYFTKLTEQYSNILLPPKDLLPNIKNFGRDHFVGNTKYRVAWTKQQNLCKKKEEEDKEKEKLTYSRINWHVFKIVGYVDPFDSLDLPPMIRPEDVGARLIAEERYKNPLEVKLDEPIITIMLNDIPKKKFEERNLGCDADTVVQDMVEDCDSDEGESQKESSDVIPPLPVGVPGVLNSEKVIIRKDYDPKSRKNVDEAKSETFLRCPITDDLIPTAKFDEHMRINLLNPKWVEQRDRIIKEKHEQDGIYADGSTIAENLKRLAKKRTDIFGGADVDIGIPNKEEEKEQARKINPDAIWDGHSSSSAKVSQLARQNYTIEDQIKDIHKSKGLAHDENKQKIGPTVVPPTIPPTSLPPTSFHPNAAIRTNQTNSSFSRQPPNQFIPSVVPAQPIVKPVVPCMPTPGPMGFIPPLSFPMCQPPLYTGMIPQVSMAPMPIAPPGAYLPGCGFPASAVPNPTMGMSEACEPPNKKSRLEGFLIPEKEFLARYPHPVEFKVQLPSVEKSNFKLKGQLISITLPLSDTVSVVKAKIFVDFGMPAGKQKFQFNGVFLNDSHSLAHYNVGPNSVLELQVKERGGKK